VCPFEERLKTCWPGIKRAEARQVSERRNHSSVQQEIEVDSDADVVIFRRNYERLDGRGFPVADIEGR
jgi:hypothetical protein